MSLKYCSWCLEPNEIEGGSETFCHGCGHRADVPCAECDCPECLRLSPIFTMHDEGEAA